jgi:hypothetical protein
MKISGVILPEGGFLYLNNVLQLTIVAWKTKNRNWELKHSGVRKRCLRTPDLFLQTS